MDDAIRVKMNNAINLLIRELNLEKENHQRAKTSGDLSDVGSTIGVVIAVIIRDNKDKPGFDKETFMLNLAKGFELVETTES